MDPNPARTAPPAPQNVARTTFLRRLFSPPTSAPEDRQESLWEPQVLDRTKELVFVLALGVLLLWPANDWRLPLIERFAYEVADGKKRSEFVATNGFFSDTITGLFIPAIPLAIVATLLGFFEIQILKKNFWIFRYFTPLSLLFGILGLFIHVFFVYYEDIFFFLT
jgi:hypothetical protein